MTREHLGLSQWALREVGRGQPPLGSSEIKVFLNSAQSLKFCRGQTAAERDGSTTGVSPCLFPTPCPAQRLPTLPNHPSGQLPGGGCCTGSWKYLCAGPCGPGLWGPRAPGAPVPLGLAARRRRREEQLLQLQREGARKGVGIAARAGENARGATAPWLTCEHINHRASDPRMGHKIPGKEG